MRLHHSFSHLFIPLRRCGPVSVFYLAGADCPCRGTFARLRFSGIHTLGYRTPFGLFPFFSHFPFCLAQIRESIAEFFFPPLVLRVPSPTRPHRLRFLRLQMSAGCSVCFFHGPFARTASGFQRCRAGTEPAGALLPRVANPSVAGVDCSILLFAHTLTFFQPFIDIGVMPLSSRCAYSCVPSSRNIPAANFSAPYYGRNYPISFS